MPEGFVLRNFQIILMFVKSMLLIDLYFTSTNDWYFYICISMFNVLASSQHVKQILYSSLMVVCIKIYHGANVNLLVG